jgi:hypothetical protein
MKQTAVEWLIEAMYQETYPFNPKYSKIFKQAKEIEKEQMCKFAYKCHNHYKVYGDFKIEEYYNKTFKSE